MKKNLKVTFVGALLVALLSVSLVGTTFSYFTDAAAQGGNYPVGGITTTITEEKDGYAVKKPSVQNTGKSACYVRMRYSVLQDGLVTVNAPANGWTYDGQEWYYYNTPIAPGESTKPLFDTVALGDGYTAADLAHLQISLYQEAVQSELTYQGKVYTDPAEIWALYEAGFLSASSSNSNS